MLKKKPDLITISLGAGLQSSLLCEMVIAGELPPVDFVIFADTGDEPDYVYAQVWYLAEKLATVNIPLIVVNNGNLVEDIYANGRFAAMPLFTKQLKGSVKRTKKQHVPDGQMQLLDELPPEIEREYVEGFGEKAQLIQIGRLKRQCTSEYKIVPIERFIRQELLRRGLARQYKNGAIHVNKGVLVESWLGITYDELRRMKPAKTWFFRHRWPLIEKRMTRADCTDWYESKGLTPPKKSSCIRCPFHIDDYFIDMQETAPDDWQQVTNFDDDLRNAKLRIATTAKGEVFLHESCIPLSEVELNPGTDSMRKCGGYCWV